jgi:SAM-dependent methyltransferase
LTKPTPSDKFAKLETRGRKTGLPHMVELRWVSVGDSFYLFAGSGTSDWVLNSLQSGAARLRLSESLIDCSATLATQPEKEEAKARFVEKYGRSFFEQWYRNSQTCIRLTPRGPPIPRRSTSGELDARRTYAEWTKSGSNFYTDVGEAFDSASEEYDFTIGHNFINTWIRKRSLDVLTSYIRPTDLLLEVGCGTGAETTRIARLADSVVAIDISPKMLEALEAKARAKGLDGKIHSMRLAAGDVSQVAPLLGGRKANVAYSLNGALNCEPRLPDFVRGVHSLLAPGGYLICSVRNTICLGEMLSHALVLQFEKATPRKKQPSMVSVGGANIPSTYYSPQRFSEFFAGSFDVVRTIALPAILPPAYLNDYYLKFRRGISVFERADVIVSERFPFRLLGDQTLFVFRKSDDRTIYS